LLDQRVQLIAQLLAHLQHGVALEQPLLEFVIYSRWRRPASCQQQRTEAGEGLSIDGVALGALEQGLGEVVGLSRIDHADG
jgi:hypothetical protein